MKVQNSTPRKTLNRNEVNELTSLYDRMEEILGGFDEGLSTANRRRLVHLDRGNLLFVRDVADTLSKKPTLCPGYLNAAEIIDEYQFYRQLEELTLLHKHAFENLRDMKVILGDKCYRQGLSVYRAVRDAKENNVPGSKVFFNQLHKRFTGQGNSSPSFPSNEEETETLTPVESTTEENGSEMAQAA